MSVNPRERAWRKDEIRHPVSVRLSAEERESLDRAVAKLELERQGSRGYAYGRLGRGDVVVELVRRFHEGEQLPLEADPT